MPRLYFEMNWIILFSICFDAIDFSILLASRNASMEIVHP